MNHLIRYPLKKSYSLILIGVLLFCVSMLARAMEEQKPNILWITGEDMSASWLACYGNKQIKTPNFDKFAKEGFLYTRCFANAPVCAPSRSSWIMGIHPVSTGTIYMRSLNEISKSLVWYPDALRANGYYTANYHKTDYNTSNRKDKAAGFGGGENRGTCGHYNDTWDSYENECWKNPNRKANQPFFQVANTVGCHESYLQNSKNANESVDPATMKLAAYHPDIPEMRMDYARYTAGVMKADRALGQTLEKLKEDGIEEDTIVIYTSDHGGIIGRSKRFLFDSGTQTPLIIRIPEKFKKLWPAENPGAHIERLVSFIDMPKTWLAITGSPIPNEMQGNVFLGEKQDTPRKNIFIARERMDEVPDMQRAVRDTRYLYIRNYEPFRPNGQYLEYLWKAPSMKAWEAYHKAGKTTAMTGAFFQPKSVEQLFDCDNDPDNAKNLADAPAQAQRLSDMREELRKQQILHYDCGFLPEGILVERAKRNQTTIYEMIRNPKLYDQQGYMKAADLANFAKSLDLPRLIEMLKSDDEAYRFWGVNGCIRLGKQAATPEVLTILEKLINTDLNDDRTLDIRGTAAFYLCQIDKKRNEAVRSLLEVVTSARNTAPGRGRALANINLLSTNDEIIKNTLKNLKTSKNRSNAE